MAQPYFTAADVALFDGRLAGWFSGKDSTSQATLIEMVCARVDLETAQDGGLLAQTNKTVSVSVFHDTDTVRLPNKPILSISAITIQPRMGASFPADVEVDSCRIAANYMTYRGTGAASSAAGTFTPMLAYRMAPFVEGDQVQVTYSCGLTAPTTDLRLACVRLLGAIALGIMDNPQGYTLMRTAGGQMISHGATTYENPAMAEAISYLEPYSVA